MENKLIYILDGLRVSKLSSCVNKKSFRHKFGFKNAKMAQRIIRN